MKKIMIVTLLVVFMVSILFIGISCKKEVAPAEGAEEVASAEKVEKKKIVFWHIHTLGNDPIIIQNAVDRFMAENPDVEVEVVPIQDDPYKTKLKIAMGAESPPDIFTHWTGGPMIEYVKSGQILDLTEMMNKDNYKDYFLDAAIGQATYDGRIWAVPVEDVSIAAIFYNKQIFEDLNISIPETYDELIEIIELLKSEGMAPFALANKTKWTGSMYYMYLVDRLGGPDVFSKAANREGGSFEDEAFIKAGEMLQDLVKMGAFNEGFNGLDWDTGQSRTLLYSGNAVMELMGTWNVSTIADENPEFYEKLDFFPFPAIEGGQGDPSNVVGSIGQDFYSISAKCKYPEEAFRLLQFLIDEESVKERAANNRIVPIKGFTSDNPALKEIINILENAPSVQLWYDQYLPPELGEVHLDTCQALMGLEMTPEEAAKAMEDAAKKFYEE